MIHGLGSQWQIWAPVLDQLARERDVVAIDLPGFGESPVLTDGAPTVEALADVVAGFCREEFGWAAAAVGGNSLGGGVALQLARSGFASAVCAISPIGFYSDRELALARANLLAGRKVARRIASRADDLMRLAPFRVASLGMYCANPLLWPSEEAARALRALGSCPGWEATFESAIGWRWTGEAPAAPVTIAWGTRDAILIPSQARRAARELPDARHVPLRRRGHTPMWEAPDEVARLLLDAGSREEPAVRALAGT